MQRRIPTRAFLCLVSITFLIFTAFAGSASAQTAVGFNTPPPIGQYVIQGCNNDGTFNFPSTNNAEHGGFVCPDSAYTTGNLGKNWNELDLVPFRVTTSTNKKDTVTTYNLVIAGEFSRTGVIGWDVIGSDAGTGPTKNPNSDASCSATWNGFFTNGPGIGGSDSSIYRTLTITQNPGTTCIWDYYMRLSAEAANYSGSNLHGFMFQTAGFTQGESDVPIPVNFGVQAIQKDMTATQPTQIVWNITKKPSPANLTFGNVCDTSTPLSRGVTITVDWTASAPQPDGSITITTHVYATNPAHRAITVSATDNIFVGATPSGTPLHTTTGPPVVVPANTTMFLILTDTATDPVQTDTTFSDKATGTYSDPVTGVPITETTTATATATVSDNSPINGSATIEDTETISPFPTFSFSLDSFTGSGGFTGGAVSSPSGYTLGTQVTSVPLVWDSNSVSSSGEVVFNKTVDFNGTGAGSDTGTLSDQAVVKNGSTILAGPTATSVTGVSSAPVVKLTINKTITPSPFGGSSAVTFTFHVKDASNTEVAGSPFTVTFNPGDSSPKSVGPISLAPSTFSITEDPVTGWITDNTTHTIDLTASSAAKCTASPTFSNTQQGHIIVKKVTNPSSDKTTQFTFTPSYNGGVTFQLGGGGSNDSGPINPGTYSVSESTVAAGWDLTNSVCDGTGNTPASINLGAGQTVTCTFTNSKPDANITIGPTTATNPVNQQHTFTIVVTQIPNGDTAATSAIVTTSITPAGFTLVSDNCDGSPVAFVGNTATCQVVINSTTPTTYTATATAVVKIGNQTLTRVTGDSNTGDSGPATKIYVAGQIQVVKVTNPAGSSQSFSFTPSYEAGFSLTGQAGSNSNLSGFLAPGSGYSVSEKTPTGWLQTGASCDNGNSPSNITVTAGQTVTCTFTNTQEAKVQVAKTFNGGPIPAGACGTGSNVINPCAFTFQLRQGASSSSAGTILETGVASANNGGIINFSTFLVPGQTYELCEQLMAGWMTTLGPPLYSVFNPSGDNSVVCTNFTATPGQTVTFNINNLPPPGGLALTIGFWKNWASCAKSNGNQKPVLDQTLASFSGGGVLVGNLFVNTCQEAVDILNKATLSGKKESSNPFYNLAAQLLAADLNIQAGAGVSSCVLTDITSAQNLLVAVGFNGTSVPTGTSAQQAIANNLQTQLNNYNNNLPVTSCITFP